jgi:DNA-binding Lrp family transcriptional regulator
MKTVCNWYCFARPEKSEAYFASRKLLCFCLHTRFLMRRIAPEKLVLAQAMLRLKISQRKICKFLRISRSGMMSALQRPTSPKTARKQKASSAILSELRRQQRRKELPSCASVAKVVGVSRETVRRHLNRAGLCARVRPRCPRSHPGDAKKRQVFSRKELRLGAAALRNTVFTDEKIFTTNDHSCRFAWVRKGEPVPRRCESRWGPSVHVYAAIGHGVRFICVLPQGRRIGASDYVRRCLSPLLKVLPATARLQQDGAPCHTAASTSRYLQRKGVNVVDGWPPRSPHLNVIENLWAKLQRNVSDRLLKAPVNDSEELGEIVCEEFALLPDSYVASLVDDYPGRLRKSLTLR